MLFISLPQLKCLQIKSNDLIVFFKPLPDGVVSRDTIPFYYQQIDTIQSIKLINQTIEINIETHINK